MLARAIRPATGSRALAQCTLRAELRPLLAVSSPTTKVSGQGAPTATRRHRHTSSTVPKPSPHSSRPRHLSTHATVTKPEEEYIPGTAIRVLRTVSDVRGWTSSVDNRRNGDRLALVPTMGALHAGHTRLLVDAARRGHDKILVSIYVNPAQFGAAEDLDSYPKTWEGDCAVLRDLVPVLRDECAGGRGGALEMAVFVPTTAEMYPSGFPGQDVDSKGSFVIITPVGELLEGRTRPTFFRGVATVCMKLFQIAQPGRVFFGQKDVQQTVVIRKMVRDFHLPVDVAVVPTVREEGDGLALSSRNVYLGARRRRVAPVLVNALRAAERAYMEEGKVQAADVVPAALGVILGELERQMKLPPREGVLFQLDYISLADPDTMEEVEEVDPAKGAILSGAIKMLPVHEAQEGEDLGHHGGPPVRLIDNIILPPKI